MSASVRNGSARLKVPTDFVGRGSLVVKLPATPDFLSSKTNVKVRATARRLRKGDRGRDVKALVQHLRELRFYTPKPGRRYTNKVGDVVLAFRKAHDLPRNKWMTTRVWRELVSASPMRPRRHGSGTYIEVDKTRQIMMVVRDGKVLGTMHVSTGKTGNTPEGRFGIFQRGGSYLYRYMAFKGNFGWPGYNPVPAYPASHGCVRQPMWAADWTFRKTTYGTTVHVYR